MIDVFDLITKRTVDNFRIAFIEKTGMSLSFSDTEHKQYNTYYADLKCEFCRRLNASKKGLSRCIRSSREAGKKAAGMQKPMIYWCHAGLCEIVMPILLNGEHIGSVYSGQVLPEPPNRADATRLADALGKEGVDTEGLVEAYMQIPVVPMWKIDMIAELLSIFVDYMVETEINAALEEQIKREKQKLSELKPYVQNEFVGYILGNQFEKLVNVREKLEFLGLYEVPDTLLLCCLDHYDAQYAGQDEQYKARLNGLVQRILEETVRLERECLIHALGDGAFLVLVSLGDTGTTFENRRRGIRIAEDIRKALRSRTSFSCCVGIGTRAENSAHLGKAYKEALRAITYAHFDGKSDQVLHISDVRTSEIVRQHTGFDAEKLSISVMLGARDEFDRLISLFFNDMLEHGHIHDVMARCMDVLQVVASTAASQGVADADARKLDVMRKILQQTTAKDALHVMRSQVHEIMQDIAEQRKKQGQYAIIRAKNYIDAHFQDEIGLDEIASHVYLTPNYFGAIFKKEEGISCVEYLNRVRVRHAKGLLESTQRPLAVIAQEAGYKDANYFGQVFKKMEGMRPSDYRKSLRAAKT